MMIGQFITKRRNDLDALKGIAIIAVILYHIGILRSGYLGVDVFFVIGGFLVVPKVWEQININEFKYIKFVSSRLFRLLPLILLACIISLAFGIVFMLPDDFENISESVIASTFFSNNILSAITTKNYWNTVNEYKPLMHLWYVGVLAEFYAVFPIILIVENKIGAKLRKKRGGGVTLLFIASIVSLILFLSPFISDGDKFYYLPCRFFELAIGGLIGILLRENKKRYKNKFISNLFVLCIIALFFVGLVGFDFSQIGAETKIIGEKTVYNSLILSNKVLVLLTVTLSSGILLCGGSFFETSKLLSTVGKRSYSLFIFHQVILAFYRYAISNKITIAIIVVYLIFVFALSELSYRFIEKIKLSKISGIVSIIVAAFCTLVSGIVYMNAGVVRDVPELGIYVSDVHRGMHAEYCDRIYSYDKAFSDYNDKINVLVVGNSFARDWCNVLLESKYSNIINLSYSYDFNSTLEGRVNMADCLFVFMDRSDVPEYVWECERLSGKIWAIGTKSFGINNGIIYAKRFQENYYDASVTLSDGYIKLNNRWHDEWENMYIDMIEPVKNAEGNIRIFTDDHMFISQDCKHLTKAGAEYYARIIKIREYLPGIE